MLRPDVEPTLFCHVLPKMPGQMSGKMVRHLIAAVFNHQARRFEEDCLAGAGDRMKQLSVIGQRLAKTDMRIIATHRASDQRLRHIKHVIGKTVRGDRLPVVAFARLDENHSPWRALPPPAPAEKSCTPAWVTPTSHSS